MTTEIPASTPPALFTLDLGANGGVLAPKSASELFNWVQAEIQTWSWLSSVGNGGHKNAIDAAIQPLRSAVGTAQSAVQSESNSPDSARQYAAQTQAFLQQAYVTNRFPHSASPLGIRVEEIRVTDPLQALA